MVCWGCVGCGVWSVFFFKQKTAYEMRISDWSSDVCSSDLVIAGRVDEEDRGVALFDRGGLGRLRGVGGRDQLIVRLRLGTVGRRCGRTGWLGPPRRRIALEPRAREPHLCIVIGIGRDSRLRLELGGWHEGDAAEPERE